MVASHEAYILVATTAQLVNKTIPVLQKRNIAVGACQYGMPTKFVCGVVSSLAAQAMTVLQLRAAMLQPKAVRI